MREIWKDIQGYEGLYQISNHGRIYSVRYNRFRKPKVDKYGYMTISIGKDSNLCHFFVHRLVANAFVPNPNDFPEVNHIDGNKANNSADNLEWCDHYTNIRHAYNTGLMPHPLKPKKETRPRGMKLTESQVKEIRSQYIPGDLIFGCKPLARRYGVAPTTIKQIINQQIWREA